MISDIWAVVTSDDWLCYGIFADEESAAKVAICASRMYGVSARTVHLRQWSWKEWRRWEREGEVVA